MKSAHTVVVIGAGFGGICMGHYLRKAGITDFIILEKASSAGGTWRENTYPGAECDIPSALYSYSFAPNPSWDFKWAKQKQILAYIEKTAETYGITPHIQFNRAVRSCRFDNLSKEWTVTDEHDNQYKAKFVISAVGQLHHPHIPQISGLKTFKGPVFHSAEWDHSIDLTNKIVAVIGNAASAVQLIPEVAKMAGQLDVYQRSANWVLKKFDKPANRWDSFCARYLPFMAKVNRARLWASGEYGLWPAIQGKALPRSILKWMNQKYLKEGICDPDIRKKLTPNYPIGAKRILFSDGYYDALARDNVTLLTDGISKMTSDGLIDDLNIARPYDVIIFATGFHTNPFLQSIDVTGAQGQSLKQKWSNGAFAYLGITTHGFPNFAMMYGPNTNTGHTSIIYKLECQARYIIQYIEAGKTGALDVKQSIESQFNIVMQKRLRELAWNKVEASWYKDGDKITNNWMGSASEYRRRTKALNLDDYIRI